MKIVFFLIAAGMTAVALVFVLGPLLRAGRQGGQPRNTFVLALCIALLLPVGVVGIYALVGTPMALNGTRVQAVTSQSIDQAISALTEHLKQEPGDLAGWMLLAQTSTSLRHLGVARDAYDHALKLAPNNADAMVGWAEADSMLRPDHMIDGRARDLLKNAVQLQPDSQRGLFLLGISDFQHGRYGDAQATWRLLQPQLVPGSEAAKAIAEQIAVAAARAAAAPANAASTTPVDKQH
ncbi:MAG: cytochrome C biogenesis protein [Rhodanobacter sp.]